MEPTWVMKWPGQRQKRRPREPQDRGEPRVIRHGMTGSPEWVVWKGMIERCTDENSASYRNYGARGVTVCPSWRESFQAFFDCVGPRPSMKHTLDRIEGSKGYEPGNVRWATKAEQNRNTRRNVVLEYQGRSQVLEDWATELGLHKMTIWNRLFKLGWSTEEALSTPPRRKKVKTDGDSRS